MGYDTLFIAFGLVLMFVAGYMVSKWRYDGEVVKRACRDWRTPLVVRGHCYYVVLQADHLHMSRALQRELEQQEIDRCARLASAQAATEPAQSLLWPGSP